MHISRLALDHYRSWSQVVVDFVPGVNILFGKNGLGKTNLVEAVEVLSTGSSHRTSSTLPLIERGQTTATIRANVADDAGQTTTYEASIHARGANRARINSGSSLYLRDIIGKIPSVSFTPEDQRLVSGDPGARRTMMNQAAALLEPGYMQTLQQFTRIAKQRATLLKQLNANVNNGQPMDAVLSGLEIWTGQFIEAGVALTRMRAHVIGLLAEPFAAIYADLAGAGEQVTLTYAPSFDEVLMFDDPHPQISEHFQRIYPGEVARGVNLIGPQRDDMNLEFEIVRDRLGLQPIVILDDVFAQLDDSRRTQILDFARKQDQVLITVAAEGDVPDYESAHRIDVAALDEPASVILPTLGNLSNSRENESLGGYDEKTAVDSASVERKVS